VLNELVNGRTNELISSSELMGIKLLNAVGEPVASAGIAIDLDQKDLVQEGERGLRIPSSIASRSDSMMQAT